jgi:hypothetical protein
VQLIGQHFPIHPLKIKHQFYCHLILFLIVVIYNTKIIFLNFLQVLNLLLFSYGHVCAVHLMLLCCGIDMSLGVSAGVDSKAMSRVVCSMCTKASYGKQEYIVCCDSCAFHFCLSCLKFSDMIHGCYIKSGATTYKCAAYVKLIHI